MTHPHPLDSIEPPTVVVRLATALDPLREQQIGPGEPIGAALRRICLGRLDRAIENLTDPAIERNEGVHTARKGLKRVRAIIRLTRDTVGYSAYRQENVVLRDTARALAPVRDSFVMVQTLDGLTGRYRRLLAPDAFSDMRRVLIDRHRETFARVAGDRQVVADVVTNLRTCRRRFASWPGEGVGPGLVPDLFGSIASGLYRVYRRGRRGMAAALDQETAGAYHEWRKRAKYLRYQLEALEPLWPSLIGGLVKELDALGETLGDEHDLDQLGRLATGEGGRVLRALIAEERAALRAAAAAGGARTYAERPDEFVRRIGAYWAASGRH